MYQKYSSSISANYTHKFVLCYFELSRLVMNLMNAYVQESDEFECIYASYCEKLNNQVRIS